MAAVSHFEFAKFWYFVTWPSLESKSAVAHQISLKSDDPRMGYSDETIFKIAAVRHLQFSKIAIFVMRRVSENGYTCTDQISRQSDNNSWRYSQKTIFNMAAVRHFEFNIFFYKSACDRSWNQSLSPHTKFHRMRMIPGWDIAIKPFSKWRPSAILNFQNLVHWSRDLCLNVILLLRAKCPVNRTINRGDLAKRRFSISSRPPFWICNIWYFVT